MAWHRNLPADLVKKAKHSVGGLEAWNRVLTERMKEALLAEQVLAVVVGQAGETVRVESVEELWHATRRVAGIEF